MHPDSGCEVGQSDFSAELRDLLKAPGQDQEYAFVDVMER